MCHSGCRGHPLVSPVSQELLIRPGLMRLACARLSFRPVKAGIQHARRQGETAEEGVGAQLPVLGPL